MIEATHDPYRPARAPAGPLPRTINGAPLRWMPGPDELRLPDCEAEPVPQNTRQLFVIVESVGTLRQHWLGRRDVFVGGDQFVYWHRKKAPVSPDVLVAFGVAGRHHRSYVVWEEGKPPDFVLEVVSPSSRERDEKEKREIYAEMGVPEYFWYDPKGKLEPALAGFGLCDGKYAPLPEETVAEGVVGIRSEVLGLCLCIRPTTEPYECALHWYDLAAGEFLPARRELADDKRRLADDKRRLVARVAELEAILERKPHG